MAEPLTDPDPTTDQPGWEIDEDGNVNVAGLIIPGPLAVQVIAAMRSIYPSVTDGLADTQAVQAVLKHWVTTTLQEYAARQVTETAAQQLADLQAQAEAEAARVRAAAEAAAQAIAHAPLIPEPTPTEPPPDETTPA